MAPGLRTTTLLTGGAPLQALRGTQSSNKVLRDNPVYGQRDPGRGRRIHVALKVESSVRCDMVVFIGGILTVSCHGRSGGRFQIIRYGRKYRLGWGKSGATPRLRGHAPAQQKQRRA